MATVVAILKFYSGVNLYCSFVLPIHKFSPESFTWFLCRWQKRSVVCESVMGTGVQHNLQSMWFFVFVFVFFFGFVSHFCNQITPTLQRSSLPFVSAWPELLSSASPYLAMLGFTFLSASKWCHVRKPHPHDENNIAVNNCATFLGKKKI